MRIETKMKMDEYIEVVNEIAEGFFNEDGSYIPHIGKIAAMQAFFNHCVKEHDYNTQQEEQAIADDVFSDDGFVSAFNAAIFDSGRTTLDFGNAYRDALKIVDDRNGSVMRLLTAVSDFITKYMDPDHIAELFGESSRWKEIATGDNVISIKEGAIKK